MRPSWIFLRGLTRESRHWGQFPDVFREHFPDAHIVAIDLPGCGRYRLEESPARIAAMVEHCREEAGARQVRGPCHLLALSLGALVAVDWAWRYPGEIRDAVLVNTSLRPFSPLHHRLRPRNVLALLRMSLLDHDARARESLILRLTSETKAHDGKVLEEWIDIWRDSPVARGNAWRQLLAAAFYRAPASKPSVPLLVLASAADRLVDPRCSESLARHWELPLIRHPLAGHDLPLDDAKWVAIQVRRWLAMRS